MEQRQQVLMHFALPLILSSVTIKHILAIASYPLTAAKILDIINITMLKKIITITSLLFFITSFASSQSLVELSKKEKQRRQSVKGKKAKIITNVDLGKVKRKMGLSATSTETSVDTTSPRVTQDSGSRDRAESTQATRTSAEDETSFKTRRAGLEQKQKKAQEYVDLLTTKINGLWQEFYSQDDMTYRGRIQAEISETHLRLQKARQDESLAKQELDKFFADARNRGVPAGWIR